MNASVQYRQLAETLAAQLKSGGKQAQLPSVRELARQHNVSSFTVSKALRLLEIRGAIVRQWGVGCFAAEKAARLPRTTGRRNIGLLLNPLQPPWNGWSLSLSEGLVAALQAENADITYVSWREHLTLDLDLDGLIVGSNVLDTAEGSADAGIAAWVKEVAAGGLPVVLVDCALPGVSSVEIDNEAGAYQAARYLVQLGHRDIAWLGAPDNYTSNERLAGLRKALREAGLNHPDALVWNARPSPRIVCPQFPSFYQARPFTAICCFEDGVATAVIKAARDLGLRVPERLSVVGFGNLTLGEFASLPLTTVDVRQTELAGRALRLLLDMIGHPPPPPQPVRLRVPTQLIVRDSTGPAPQQT